MRTYAAPFPVAPPDAVRFTVPWELDTPAGSAPLTDDIPVWDYQARLAVSAEVIVDTRVVRDACHLGEKSALHLVVLATSSTTRMRGPVVICPVSVGPVRLEAELVGQELGGRLGLDTLLVVSTIDAVDALSPKMAGSILWRHRKRTWLEGESSRFPTEVADLGAAPFFTPGALWFLDIRSEDLDSAALGAVRLVLNDKHPAVARLLAGDQSEQTAATMSALRWDVARQLVSVALDSDEFVERDGVFDDETFGSILAGVLTMYWPGETASSLRQLRRTDPSTLERQLQDRSGLLSD
jgi:hypothetical protein